jgi:hypothetical protein
MLRWEPITPGRLDQNSPRRALPDFRDSALAACGAAGAVGRNQTEIRHELAGIGEAGDIAEFGDQTSPSRPGPFLATLVAREPRGE